MATVDRRKFLQGSAAVAAGAIAGATPMRALAAPGGLAERRRPGRARDNGGYGPLQPARDKATGKVFLHLPTGFQYRLFSQSGTRMTDGFRVPGRSDGMAAFAGPNGKVRLVRNHEIFFDPGHVGPVETAYDPGAGGATTTVEVSAHAEHVESWLSINGTNGNCAGGMTPWGSWLTCEETINGPDANISFMGVELDLEEQHGFVFEVPVSRGPGELVKPTPIRKAGRFTHEAVAIDPRNGYMYETQDDFASPSGFFRYIPPSNPMQVGRMEDGGVLEVLSVSPEGSTTAVDVSVNQTPGVTYQARWIRIEDPDPTFPQGIGNDEAAAVLMNEGVAKGAAIFSRLEGIWYGDRKMFFNSTHGGGPFPDPPSAGFGEGFGQVWVYDLDRETLTLLFESPGQDVLDLPDNLTVTPGGSLLLCEDSSGANFLRGLTLDGEIFDFARNAVPGQEGQEFAGATFSPDGKTLFVNIQMEAAMTFAIWGPWAKGVL